MTFALQGFGPFLHWLTLVILCIFPVAAMIALYKLGSLPGAIAASRGHPQAAAINVCGWMGVVTLVLWPIAMVWAYTNAKGATLDGGHDAALISDVRAASKKLAIVESRLSTQKSSGA